MQNSIVPTRSPIVLSPDTKKPEVRCYRTPGVLKKNVQLADYLSVIIFQCHALRIRHLRGCGL